MQKFNYSLVFISLIFLCKLVSSQPETIILNPNNVQYTMPCGNTTDNACPDIASALNSTSSANVILNLGNYTYTGPNNTFINLINITVTIQGNQNGYATINMANNSYFISMLDNQQSNGNVSLTLQYLNIVNGSGFHGMMGGVIYISTSFSNSILILDNVIATNNNAYYGGVVYLKTSQPSYITISNSTFRNNSANFGAVFYTDNYSQTNISNTNIIGNQAEYGIIFVTNGTISFNNVLVDSNVGGNSVLRLNSNGNVSVYNMTLTNNYVSPSTSPLTSSIVLSQQNNLQFYNSQISNNTGTPITFSSKMTLFISNTHINGNNAPVFGGAIVVFYGTLAISSSVISSNYALLAGGGVYIFDSLGLTIVNTNFSSNAVSFNGTGSALYINNIDTKVLIVDVTFSDNLNNDTVNPVYCDSSSVTMSNITSADEKLLTCVSEKERCKFSGNYDIAESSCPAKSGLGSGAIAGIIIGSIAGLLLLILVIYILKKRHHNHHKYKSYN
ncbi:hypothetical protein PPL_10080 [Heterostelium album PN500]|uniref:Right handed beta helix domain-containing protein n=1 Tax=Heterostelium pallidum (strain ATCC 26659 / Pp 5 / PN500) TaxID=670386 RepID=D3BQ97_HETP5|nr:hypothetical protein PPL_10080 [Heterostelium album PN500]EFA76317.1 hypothetical protein PPL_10080 [Heterostelium album PN500]|eukprot:XP_020428449.1 hypothetical protein PPL_10080 [Heterostelium album PN500]